MRWSSCRAVAVLLFSGSGAWAQAGDRYALAPEAAPPRSWLAPLRDKLSESVAELKREDLWADSGHWRVIFSPYTWHYRYSAEHRDVFALGLERQRVDQWLGGFSLFRNSFGQPSAFAYLGRRFPGLLDEPQLFGQLTGGVLYGYRGKYKSKVPLNVAGFAPGAVASLGWQFNPRWSVMVHALGDAGLMFQMQLDLR